MTWEQDEPVFTPLDVIRYASETRKVPIESFHVPERLVVTYQRSALEHVQQSLAGKQTNWLYGETWPVYALDLKGADIGVFRSPVGASAAAFVLEELIACGAGKIVEVGMAGAIQSNLKLGDGIVVTEAVRDEGTSQHYFPPEVRLESTGRLREAVVKALEEETLPFHVGPIWTTDGVYRETKGKLLKFKRQGVLAVDMETSALFAVAKHRGAEIASVQVISDILSETKWFPAFRQENVLGGLRRLFSCVIEALSRS